MVSLAPVCFRGLDQLGKKLNVETFAPEGLPGTDLVGTNAAGCIEVRRLVWKVL